MQKYAAFVVVALVFHVGLPTSLSDATEPSQVPEYVRYGMFITQYQQRIRPAIIQNLPSFDDAVLMEIALKESNAMLSEGQKYNNALIDICSSRGSNSTQEIAKMTDQLVEMRIPRHSGH